MISFKYGSVRQRVRALSDQKKIKKRMFEYLKRWFPAGDEVSKPKAAAGQAIEMLRREYSGKPLKKREVNSDPIK
jgi:hypothetical protein